MSYINIDEKGVAWIEETTTKVRDVTIEHIAYGHSAAEIHFQHPYLSPAQVHAAFAYCYSHQEAVDAEIEHDHNATIAEREQAGMSPFAKKLDGLARAADSRSPAAKVSLGAECAGVRRPRTGWPR